MRIYWFLCQSEIGPTVCVLRIALRLWTSNNKDVGKQMLVGFTENRRHVKGESTERQWRGFEQWPRELLFGRRHCIRLVWKHYMVCDSLVTCQSKYIYIWSLRNIRGMHKQNAAGKHSGQKEWGGGSSCWAAISFWLHLIPPLGPMHILSKLASFSSKTCWMKSREIISGDWQTLPLFSVNERQA